MKPDPAAPADQLNLLRQQLILAQVRIMELEDTRDELTPRLIETEKLLTAAQEIADHKLDEAAHLEKVRGELQTQYEHMRHMQHVTNEALASSRAEAAMLAFQAKNLLDETEKLHVLTQQLAQTGREQLGRLSGLAAELGTAQAESTAKSERIGQVEAERIAMKMSRSWRWTAWLRSLERTLGGRRQ